MLQLKAARSPCSVTGMPELNAPDEPLGLRAAGQVNRQGQSCAWKVAILWTHDPLKQMSSNLDQLN
jgi:hypothetical protein